MTDKPIDFDSPNKDAALNAAFVHDATEAVDQEHATTESAPTLLLPRAVTGAPRHVGTTTANGR